MTGSIVINEVGLRDGLQSQAKHLTLDERERLACHFHDTRAMGLANVFAAIESGVRRFDSSVGGLGGCPFAPGAKGNVATEDVVMLCESMGFSTGVDMAALLRAVDLVSEAVEAPQGGRAHFWLSNNVAAG